jgi:hypothetical protein
LVGEELSAVAIKQERREVCVMVVPVVKGSMVACIVVLLFNGSGVDVEQ